MDDFPVDVCISHLDTNRVRQKTLLSSSRAVLHMLAEWKRLGHREPLLTWGRTRPVAVAELTRLLDLADIQCRGVTTPKASLSPDTNDLLTLGQVIAWFGSIACPLTAMYYLLSLRDQVVQTPVLPGLALLIGGFAGGVLCSALVTVFGRAKSWPPR